MAESKPWSDVMFAPVNALPMSPEALRHAESWSKRVGRRGGGRTLSGGWMVERTLVRCDVCCSERVANVPEALRHTARRELVEEWSKGVGADSERRSPEIIPWKHGLTASDDFCRLVGHVDQSLNGHLDFLSQSKGHGKQASPPALRTISRRPFRPDPRS